MSRSAASLLLLLALCAGAALPGAAAQAPALRPGMPPELAAAVAGSESVRPVEVLDGDTLRLADGRLLRLAAIAAPKPPLDDPEGRPRDRPGDAAWPAADAAREALARLALGRDWHLVPAGTPADRYGRLLGHLVDAQGRWLNAELVAGGFARVASRPDLRLGAAALLEHERLARSRRLGLWRAYRYRVLPAEEAQFGLNHFALVEGVVGAVATVRGRTYLNFGEDWRRDFTVSLGPAARRLFASEGVEPSAYEGRRIRVRGWVESINGPMIEVSHPEEIELLD